MSGTISTLLEALQGVIAILVGLQTFGIAVLGAFTVYFLIYRETKIALFLKEPRKRWSLFVVDFIGYLLCGGLVAIFLINPGSGKEAFMSGAGWEGILGGIGAGTQLKIKSTLGG